MARGVSWLVRTAVAIGTGLSAFAVLGRSAMSDPNRVVLRAIACTLIGVILLLASAVPIYFFAYPELRALLVFEPTVGTVTRGEVASGPGRGRTDNADIQFTFRVNGVEYNTGRYRIVDAGDSEEGATSTVARYPIGSTHPVWFDPSDHGIAVIDRSISVPSVIGMLLCLSGIVVPIWLWRLSPPQRQQPRGIH